MKTLSIAFLFGFAFYVFVWMLGGAMDKEAQFYEERTHIHLNETAEDK